MKQMAVQELADIVMQMELDLGLLTDEAYGHDARLVWEYSRFAVHEYLRVNFAWQQAAQSKKTSLRALGWKKVFALGVKLATNLTRYSWMLAPRKRQWLVFQNPRRVAIAASGKYTDIYTDKMVSTIGVKNCTLVENIYSAGEFHRRPTVHFCYSNASHRFAVRLCRIVRRFRIGSMSGVEAMSGDVSSYLGRIFGGQVVVTIKMLLLHRSANLWAGVSAYALMLRWLRPKHVLLVCSYGFEPLVIAARRKHIPVIEVQHGVMTPSHMGYQVPQGATKYSFPDFILMFGRYWRDTVHLPLSPERIFIVGYPYFTELHCQYTDRQKQNIALFISQWTIGSALSQFAVQLLPYAQQHNIKIVYKLHPGEWQTWEKHYPELAHARRQGVIDVIVDDTVNLYKLLAESKWQIGVYSTAIFEGLALGCQTYLVDLPGIDYMQPLIEKQVVQVVSEPQQVDWEWSGAPVQVDYFFAEVSNTEISRQLQSIIGY